MPADAKPLADAAKQEPPGKVQGRVTNAVTGEPLKRANITLLPAEARPDNTPFSTTSDASGSFALADIPPGKYRISVERTGYVRQEYGARGPGRMGTTISIAPAQEITQIDFRLQPHAVISGRVTDEDGEPIAHVQLQTMMYRYMQGRRQLIPAGFGMTNDLGEYRIFGLAPGRYYLSANLRQMGGMMGAIDRTAGAAPNQQELGYATTYYPGTHDPTAAVPVQVAAGRPLVNMDMRLLRTRTVRIRGKLIGGGNSPMSRPMIMLGPRDAGYSFFDRQNSTMRRPDGTFELRGITPGAYYLTGQSFDGTRTLFGRVSLDVANTDVNDVELTLSPAQELSGTARVEGDTPVSPSLVSIHLEPVVFSPMGGGGGGPVKEDGTFVVRAVAPDRYRVRAMGSQNQFYVKSVIVGQDEAKDGEFTLVQGTSPSLTVVVSTAGGQITGGVKGEKDAPAPGATVVLVPDTARRQRQDLYRTATTDQYGKFSLAGIAPGDYKLFAWDNVEAGLWMDPEFLQIHENKGKSLSMRERAKEAADLELLKTDGAEAAR